jgi:hypothetical protein
MSSARKRHEHELAPEQACRKRGAAEQGSGSPVKRGNFLEPAEPDQNVRPGGKRQMTGGDGSDVEGFKRCKPVYWRPEEHGVKRGAEDVAFLVATKKGRPDDAAAGETWPLVVSRPDRVTLLDDDDEGGGEAGNDGEGPWFQSLELSRVPRPLGRELPPEQRMVVWRDQSEWVRDRWRGGIHPPLEAARGRGGMAPKEPPRVEVLESSEDEDEATAAGEGGVVGEAEEEEEFHTGPMPMDLSD